VIKKADELTMENPNKNRFLLRIVSLLAVVVTIEVLQFADGGRIWAYMKDHFWLVCFLPLVVIFLALLVRGMYLQYRQEPEENSQLRSAHNIKS
jgi:hypothetical protein